MSQNKLDIAKELIKQKRYAQAREVLITIDDPRVASWLRQLDERERREGIPTLETAPVQEKPIKVEVVEKPPQNVLGCCLSIIVVSLVLSLLCTLATNPPF